ncbi:MAG: MmcQ/YjbR family DNA-binding protein [Ignavibacteriales bacterium]|nr:MmcQ/YjbR family DNA-binding protein [Ignavibacteriales bacterium]
MNIESFRKYCLKKMGVTEEFPFDENTLVFKVMGKIFALTDLVDLPFTINLKCDPEKAIELRERYEAVQPGYHMNKKHWNTVTIDNLISEKELLEMIDHSYDLVVSGLKKSEKEKLNKMK